MTMNVLLAPYGPDGSLLRVGTPQADWREPTPFWATLTVWDLVEGRYLVVRNLATGATYPINWGEWWPVARGQGLRLETFDPIAVVVTQSTVDALRTTTTTSTPPDDWPLFAKGCAGVFPGGWAEWATSWTGGWRVRKIGRAFGLVLDPTLREGTL